MVASSATVFLRMCGSTQCGTNESSLLQGTFIPCLCFDLPQLVRPSSTHNREPQSRPFGNFLIFSPLPWSFGMPPAPFVVDPSSRPPSSRLAGARTIHFVAASDRKHLTWLVDQVEAASSSLREIPIIRLVGVAALCGHSLGSVL